MGAARSTRRKAARNRARGDRRASAAIPSLFSPITAELMAAIEPLLEDPDPAPSELLVSHVLGIGARSTRGLGMLIGCDAEQVVVDGIVDDLARTASPPAHAALLALGAVAGGPTARRALAAARRQRLRGIWFPRKVTRRRRQSGASPWCSRRGCASPATTEACRRTSSTRPWR